VNINLGTKIRDYTHEGIIDRIHDPVEPDLIDMELEKRCGEITRSGLK